MTFFSYGRLAPHLGELAQNVIDLGADVGITVEISTNNRPRPGEVLAGAAGLEIIGVYLLGVAAREAARLADRITDAVIAWVRRRRETEQEPVAVHVFGPDGSLLKTVYVDVDGEARKRPL